MWRKIEHFKCFGDQLATVIRFVSLKKKEKFKFKFKKKEFNFFFLRFFGIKSTFFFTQKWDIIVGNTVDLRDIFDFFFARLRVME